MGKFSSSQRTGRGAGVLAGAIALWGLSTPPAAAFEFGGWFGRATLDGWYDDNLARHEAPPLDLFPRGNRDLGPELGVAVGSVFVLNPRLDVWLTASGRLSRPWFYPETMNGGAGLATNLDWRIDKATKAYVSGGSSYVSTGGLFHQADLGLERQVWPGGSAHMSGGLGYYASDVAALRYALPNASVGVLQSWARGTQVDLSYGYQQRRYEDGRSEPEHLLFLMLAQRLSPNWEVRGRYGYTLATDAQNGFHEGLGTLGLSFTL